MLYQDPQDIYHSAYKHTLEWTYTIFRHFTLLAFLNTTTHTLSKVHSKLFKWDSIWFSRPPMHWTEPWAPLRNIYIHKPSPPPRFLRHFIMLYDFRPSGWKMTIILLQQLAIKRLAEYVEWCVKKPQWCTQWELLTETHTDTQTQSDATSVLDYGRGTWRMALWREFRKISVRAN